MYIDLDLHFSDGFSSVLFAKFSSNAQCYITLRLGFFPVSPLAPLQLPNQPDPPFDPFTSLYSSPAWRFMLNIYGCVSPCAKGRGSICAKHTL